MKEKKEGKGVKARRKVAFTGEGKGGKEDLVGQVRTNHAIKGKASFQTRKRRRWEKKGVSRTEGQGKGSPRKKGLFFTST